MGGLALSRRGGPRGAPRYAGDLRGQRLPLSVAGAPGPLASVSRGQRSAQLLLAAEERGFHLDVCGTKACATAGGLTPALEEVVQALGAFLLEEVPNSTMTRRFPWYQADARAPIHEQGPAPFVEHAWSALLHRLETAPQGTPDAGLVPLVRACRRRERLRPLMPYTSINTLGLSCTTGAPYSAETPQPFALGAALFRCIGFEGSAEEMAEFLERCLKPGVGAAQHGVWASPTDTEDSPRRRPPASPRRSRCALVRGAVLTCAGVREALRQPSLEVLGALQHRTVPRLLPRLLADLGELRGQVRQRRRRHQHIVLARQQADRHRADPSDRGRPTGRGSL